jgi:chromosome segregation ATPase
MNSVKKSMMILSVILVGLLTLGGTAYAYTHHIHSVKVGQAKRELQTERESLTALKKQLAVWQPDQNGHLHAVLTLRDVDRFQQALDTVKNHYTDFTADKHDLKKELAVVATEQNQLQQTFRNTKALQAADIRQIDKARTAVDKLIPGGKISQNISHSDYEAAAKEVGKIRHIQHYRTLKRKLSKILTQFKKSE